jgi:hypothetical protein
MKQLPKLEIANNTESAEVLKFINLPLYYVLMILLVVDSQCCTIFLCYFSSISVNSIVLFNYW